MDLKGKGVNVTVNPAELSNESVVQGAQEFVVEARQRGLEIPALAGSVAVEAAQDVKVDPVDMKESLLGQLDTAFSGYQAVAERINGNRKKKEQFEVADQETLEAEFQAWLTDEKVEYMARAQETDPELRFTVIATPNNVEVTPDEAESLAVDFGKDQPYPTYMWNPILKRYTAKELSGTDPNNDNKLRFAAVPNKLTPELYGTVDAQTDALIKLQADMPDLRVSSHLDDLVYWYTLRAGGDDLAHGDVFERTYNRHFDLPEQRVDGGDYVLRSYVCDDGEPCVGGSFVRNDDHGRALVG